MEAKLVLARGHTESTPRPIIFNPLAPSLSIPKIPDPCITAGSIAVLARGHEVIGHIRPPLRMRAEMIRLPNPAALAAIGQGELLFAVVAVAFRGLEDLLAGGFGDIPRAWLMLGAVVAIAGAFGAAVSFKGCSSTTGWARHLMMRKRGGGGEAKTRTKRTTHLLTCPL